VSSGPPLSSFGSGVSHVFERREHLEHGKWGILARHEGESNQAGRRDGEGSSLVKFGYRENRDDKEDILMIEVPSLLERCFT
jgi:hypothetical protein